MKHVTYNNFFLSSIATFLVCSFFGTPVFAAIVDTDGDKLSDTLEALYSTDLNNPDTDGDGHTDYHEIYHGYSPHDASNIKMSSRDEDGDGLSDSVEFKLKTNFRSVDSDGDTYSDFDEVMYGFSPLSTSTDAVVSRKIVVDKTIQQLFIETSDGVRVKTYPVSTGNPWTPTPNGTFSMMKKVPVKRYVGPGYDLPNTKWNILFKEGGYYLHGAYWHNNFGISTNSHGCINLRTEDAEVVYKYFGEGDVVEVVGVTPKKRKVGT
jgi:hypothetical protein